MVFQEVHKGREGIVLPFFSVLSTNCKVGRVCCVTFFRSIHPFFRNF